MGCTDVSLQVVLARVLGQADGTLELFLVTPIDVSSQVLLQYVNGKDILSEEIHVFRSIQCLWQLTSILQKLTSILK